jgi:hypothetical protein
MNIDLLESIAARLFSHRQVDMRAAPCPPQQSGPTADWGASVMQSIRCELPLMESILRVM